MKNKIFIFAPSNTMADIPKPLINIGIKRLEKIGFKPVFGKYVNCRYLHTSGTVTQRVEDLNDAFSDPNVCGAMAVFGGFNTNDLLPRLSDINTDNKKWVIGYSDVSALLFSLLENNSNLQLMHGPSFASFCDPNFFNYTLESFKAAINNQKLEYNSPNFYASDAWYLKEEFGPREINYNHNWYAYKSGKVIAPIIGGNLDTLCALLGTPYFPNIKNKVLFIESANGQPGPFQRCMVQLKQAGIFDKITGLIVGKNPKGSPLCNRSYLIKVLDAISLPEYPILIDVNCSHVDPMITFEFNKTVQVLANSEPTITLNYWR